MEPDDTGTATWPRAHPSPPLPPARPDRTWLWAVLGCVLAFGLVAVVTSYVVSLVDDPAAEATSADAPAEPGPGAGNSAPVAAVRCWDGSGAESLASCSLPDGAAGLAWVFPRLSEQACGQPTADGRGVVLLVLCSSTLADGSPIQLSYYQWSSVGAGIDFYEAQGLDRAVNDEFRSWTGQSGDTFTAVLLYLDAPFSETVTLPGGAQATDADIVSLQPRPAAQLRGAPVG